ncbi:ferredoxin [Staphylothermus marinus F1]|uniref:Ferredoxin n=1 Tax=Staphylothermus marinus (strain ATCC 43588 / DSM 3639 / JCM 9404 / F1) TaxID=399550 RepID=A3DLF4_STAMF|nr:ferredoxin [Staphylothermus marinus]ABN69464.1 ferredoxin [Staphylothermus marinus F1]
MGYVKVIVDRDTCIGCGVAPATCPEVFVLGEDNGKNRVVEKYTEKIDDHISIGKVPEDLLECVKSAVDACPVSAISYEIEK